MRVAMVLMFARSLSVSFSLAACSRGVVYGVGSANVDVGRGGALMAED